MIEKEVELAEFQRNLDKYLRLVAEQDIHITRHGRAIAMLVSPYRERIESMRSLFGILSDALTLSEARSERLG